MKRPIQLSFLNTFWQSKHVLTKKDWLRIFLNEVQKRGNIPFYFSEIRIAIPEALEPDKWYREAGRMLRRHGYIKTTNWRPSPIPSRMQGDDFEYIKSGDNRQVTPRQNEPLRPICNSLSEYIRCPFGKGGKRC